VLSIGLLSDSRIPWPAPEGAQDGGPAWWRSPHVWLSAAAAVLGLVLAGALWLVVAHRQDRLAALELDARAREQCLVLRNGINAYLSKVDALRAFYDASEAVTREEFATFARGILRDQSAIPAVPAVSWIPRVTRAERAAHELAADRDGLSGYQIRSVGPDGRLSRSPDNNEYFPVFYSSSEGRGSVYGINLNDGGSRQRALERARDGNLMATSRYFQLHSGAGDRTGFFVVLPVYSKDRPHETVEERRDNLIGFVQGVFQIEGLVETILDTTMEAGGLDIYLFAAGAGPDAVPIYFHPARARTGDASPQTRAALMNGPHWANVNEIEVGDARWELVAAPIPGGPGVVSHDRAWMVAGGIVLITILVAAYIFASGRSAKRLGDAKVKLDRTLIALSAVNNQMLTHNIRFDTAINNMVQGLVMFDAAERIVVCNNRYIEMYGLSRDIVQPGCTLRELIRHRVETGLLQRDPEEYRAQLLSEMARGEPATRIVAAADGREILITIQPMRAGGWITTHEDVTERRRADARIAHMALHDALTNLPNRLFFRQEVEKRVARLGRGQILAVLCLDLDNFKEVNDTLGHPFGDKLLCRVGERLRGCLGEGDSVARLGGDEFAILHGRPQQDPDASALLQRIIDTIAAPYDLDGHQAVIGVSIGVSVAPADATDPDQLIKNADMALYRAKVEGRGKYRFFEPEMDTRLQARRVMEIDLRKAIANGEFELYYQPLVNLENDQISSFEALIRWNHPERGVILPDQFIPLAEETALIVPIGEWVLRRACQEAATWPGEVRVAVNLSPVQFRAPGVVETVVSALARSGLRSERLQVEITESVMLLNTESTLNTLHRLRALGVRISMDDFGTGYSSLSYLRSFPFDKIKIDRSFVHGLESNKESRAIIRAVIRLGLSLGMSTTVEGIETQEELDHMKREGCTEGQGFYFSKPCPAAEVRALLAQRDAKDRAVA
jgi:diguanylate cyclase (GGDEF)-like protein